MKHLLKVKAEFEYVIAVDDGEDAETVCAKFVSDALRDMSTHGVGYQTEPYRPGCVDGWEETIEPYGGAGKSTAEWLANE